MLPSYILGNNANLRHKTLFTRLTLNTKIAIFVINERQGRVEVGRAAVVGPPVEAGGKMGAMSVIRGTSTCSRSLAKKHKSVLP